MNKYELKLRKNQLLVELAEIRLLLKDENCFTLEEIFRNVERFTGVYVKNSNNSKKESVEARELFYRYSKSIGYGFSTLGIFTKCTRATALTSNKRNIKLCKTSKPKQEYYDRFLKLMENAKKEKSKNIRN